MSRFVDSFGEPVELNDKITWHSKRYGTRVGRIVRLDKRIERRWNFQERAEEDRYCFTVVAELPNATRTAIKKFTKL